MRSTCSGAISTAGLGCPGWPISAIRGWPVIRTQTRRKVPGWEARAEPSVMREADAIVVNTPGAGDLLCHAYPQYAAKMTSITNGYDPERFEANPIPPLSGSTIEIIHTGADLRQPFPGPVARGGPAARCPRLSAGRTLRVRFIGNLRTQGTENGNRETDSRGLERLGLP